MKRLAHMIENFWKYGQIVREDGKDYRIQFQEPDVLKTGLFYCPKNEGILY